MIKTTITPQTTLLVAFEEFKHVKSWSDSTTRCYMRNVNEFNSFLEENDIEPALENIDYDIVSKWVSQLEENFSSKTIKQKIATCTALFFHLNKLGKIIGNPFAALDSIEDFEENHHSRVLPLEDLYLVYKALIELENKRINVRAAVILDIFTGLRSTALKKLKVKSVNVEKGAFLLHWTIKKRK